MKVEHILDLLSKLDKNDEVFCLLYLREEANDYTEQNEIPEPNDDEWSQIVHHMNTDDGIYEEASGSFVWALEKMIDKREKTK